jgi:hypothetical protein
MRSDANVMLVGALCLVTMSSAGCLERCVAAPAPNLQSGVRIPVVNNAIENVDMLFEVDNSRSMADNQGNLARNFGPLIDSLVSPPVDPATGRRRYQPVRSLHVGVISSDLGTPGTRVGSCANTEIGDDGLLNPIRNGLAIRAHQPWTTAPAGRRPARCTNDMNQYPSFLTFMSGTTDAQAFRDDFICNAYLSTDGCGLEQQLESAYRALVIHNPREQPGNTDPNAGFVRDNAVLAIVMVTDEEDGSVRDCRYAEAGVPCTSALSVYDQNATEWSHPSDLNLRFYLYTPGSAQDPTWPIDRYIDPARPNRGFTSLKPGRPDLVIFSAIAGVPLNLPMRAGASQGQSVDWDALLGREASGADAYAGMSAEGPISMRPASRDACTSRVVPSCRRQGTAPTDSCDSGVQYFAQPSRRIAQVVRRFDERYNNGTLSSVCANDYSGALTQVLERIQSRLSSRCLPRPLETNPPVCATGQTSTTARPCASAGQPIQVNCIVREILPPGTTAATACTRDRGRMVSDRDPSTGRDTCLVDQVVVPLGAEPASAARGFWYDTRPDPMSPDCRQNVRFTAGAEPLANAVSVIECVQSAGVADDRIATGTENSCR